MTNIQGVSEACQEKDRHAPRTVSDCLLTHVWLSDPQNGCQTCVWDMYYDDLKEWTLEQGATAPGGNPHSDHTHNKVRGRMGAACRQWVWVCSGAWECMVCVCGWPCSCSHLPPLLRPPLLRPLPTRDAPETNCHGCWPVMHAGGRRIPVAGR